MSRRLSRYAMYGPYVLAALIVFNTLLSDTPLAPQRESGGCALIGTGRSVGGVSIGTDGILKNSIAGDAAELNALRARAQQEVVGDLAKPSPLRKISLRRLAAAIAAAQARRQAAVRRNAAAGRLAANSICLCLSPAARHCAGRIRRRLEGGRSRQPGGQRQRPARDAAGRFARGPAHGPRSAAGGNHLLDRSHARGPRPAAQVRGDADHHRRSANDDQHHRTSARPAGGVDHRRAADQPFRPHPRRRRLSHEALGHGL